MTLLPVHPDGWRFVGIFFLLTLVLFMIVPPLGWVGLLLTIWCIYFFRNPERVIPSREGLIVSPADGKIVSIQKMIPPSSLGDTERFRISIFLNIFDVHVNRIPIKGKVRKIYYHQGKFFNASLDKASELNERNTLVIDLLNQDIAVTQIAGLIARRIRCDVKENDLVETGQYFGLIRFGSRVDLYLPIGVEPLVYVGQRTIAGETVLADLNYGPLFMDVHHDHHTRKSGLG
ncbi:MAG: phosphatidylserine decarboxylase [Proteobacteria bacterium]|nr:phosphatidylserine decarboxylase [Pseudomonadota bacterium]